MSESISMYSAFVMIVAPTKLAEELATMSTTMCDEFNNDVTIRPEYQEISYVKAVSPHTDYRTACQVFSKELVKPLVSKDGWITKQQPKVANLHKLTPGYNLTRYARTVNYEPNLMTYSCLVGIESKKYERKHPIPNLTIFGGSNKGKERGESVEEPEVCARRECWEETKILFSDLLFSEEYQMRLREQLNIPNYPYLVKLPPTQNSTVGSAFFTIILPEDVVIVQGGTPNLSSFIHLRDSSEDGYSVPEGVDVHKEVSSVEPVKIVKKKEVCSICLNDVDGGWCEECEEWVELPCRSTN